MASMVPPQGTVTMAGVFRGQFPQAMGQMSQAAGFHPMYNAAAFMYNLPVQYPGGQYPGGNVQGQVQTIPGAGFVSPQGVTFPFNQQFQVTATIIIIYFTFRIYTVGI